MTSHLLTKPYGSQESVIIHEALPGLPKDAIQEVKAYFEECWGSRSRIDYGSGMELNFLCWMCVLDLPRR